MNITDLLSPQYDDSHHPRHIVTKPTPQRARQAPNAHYRPEPLIINQPTANSSRTPANSSSISTDTVDRNCPVHDEDLNYLLKVAIHKAGFNTRMLNDRNSLTDAILTPISTTATAIRPPRSKGSSQDIPVHIKVIGRHMNGSYRCHIGTSKASRPIQSTELSHEMRLMAVFFRTEHAKSQIISPDFIFFPTWLLHLFRYTQHETTPGRTDVRFLEKAHMAKEDHIYRLNHILNTLFRFNIKDVDADKLRSAIELGQFLFDTAGLDYRNLPRPVFFPHLQQQQQQEQPVMYPALLLLLHASRPTKFKPMCQNCNTKPASRRRLCVACYRYHLKHGEARPLRLIVANRPGPRSQGDLIHSRNATENRNNKPSSTPSSSTQTISNSNSDNLSMVFYAPTVDVTCNRRTSASSTESDSSSSSVYSMPSSTSYATPSTTTTTTTATTTTTTTTATKSRIVNHKFCANCKVKETHQWYRNLCGEGNWCETCKSYYLRHAKVRPPELFVKAAKRKVDIRSLVQWNTWSWDEFPAETIEAATMAYFTLSSPSPSLSSSTSTSTSPDRNKRKPGETMYSHPTLSYNHGGATAAAAMLTMSSHTGPTSQSRLDYFSRQPALAPNLPVPGRQRYDAMALDTASDDANDGMDMEEVESTAVTSHHGHFYPTTPPLSDQANSLRGSTSPSSRSSSTSSATLVSNSQPYW